MVNIKDLNKGIMFLCNDLQEETYSFGLDLINELNLPVFFVVDKQCEQSAFIKNDLAFIIQINDSVCLQSGYENCMITNKKMNTLLNKNPISYDKMLYYLCQINIELDFVLVFEDDVFIPNTQIVANLFDKYQNYDLIVPNNFYKSDKVLDWHWANVIDKINEPYYYSMVCAMGFSRKLLNEIKKYVNINGTLFFTEVMFNTIAMQANLKVKDIPEFKSVVWKGNWSLNEFVLLPNNVFHPMKNLEQFSSIRREIIEANNNGFEPINNLPDFLK